MRRGREARLIDAVFGPVVKDSDRRYTPTGPIEALFDSDSPPTGCVLDCCAGDGAILRVAKARGYQVAACEIVEDCRASLEDVCGPEMVTIGDWLTECRKPWNVESIVSNPAYSIGEPVARACLDVAQLYVALILRCNVLGSGTWRKFWDEHPPTRIRPVKRPSFAGPAASLQRECSKPRRHGAKNPTDAAEYAWFIWAGEPPINLRPIP